MTNKKEAEKRRITTYWWNLGTKTKDFEGTYKQFLEEKEIKVRQIKSKNLRLPGYRFTMNLSGLKIKIDDFDNADYEQSCIFAIRTFLTALGDRAKLVTPRRDYNINW